MISILKTECLPPGPSSCFHELKSPVYLPPTESLGAPHTSYVSSIDTFQALISIPNHTYSPTHSQIAPRCKFVTLAGGHDPMN